MLRSFALMVCLVGAVAASARAAAGQSIGAETTETSPRAMTRSDITI